MGCVPSPVSGSRGRDPFWVPSSWSCCVARYGFQTTNVTTRRRKRPGTEAGVPAP